MEIKATEKLYNDPEPDETCFGEGNYYDAPRQPDMRTQEEKTNEYHAMVAQVTRERKEWLRCRGVSEREDYLETLRILRHNEQFEEYD